MVVWVFVVVLGFIIFFFGVWIRVRGYSIVGWWVNGNILEMVRGRFFFMRVLD